MAEAEAGLDIRRLGLVAGVVVVITFSLLFFLYRGCASEGGRKAGFTVIYSNLDLKDAANVIARLKELTIPYEIRDEGKAVAVPKEKADQARLGLAEKKLPVGGAVGWEIFDESRLGATDFDRRIQLIRAISGELSRTIRRIDGVEDARVQVVIPESKLFSATTSPVTASVLLRLRTGADLSPQKIKGIVHLVASSVENLQPENITIIDDSGRILTVKNENISPPAESALPVIATAPKAPSASAEVVLTKEPVLSATKVSIEAENHILLTQVATMTAQERIFQKEQIKKELEHELSGKAQELLNRFYPPNAAIIKVRSEVLPAKEIEIRAKDLKIKKLTAIILLDNRLELPAKLKAATFTTVAAAIGYNKKRGDSIIIQKVPFHLATPFPVAGQKGLSTEVVAGSTPVSIPGGKYLWWLLLLLVSAVLLFWGLRLFRARTVSTSNLATASENANPSAPMERTSVLDQVRSMADRDPEQIAQILKKWLSE